MKVHVKNNRWRPGSFPNTPEGEAVFTISQERIDIALAEFPDLAGKVEFFVDWDTDNFTSSMSDADILLTWDLPTEALGSVAPRLRWIHCIGAGVEHLLPMNWLPEPVTLTNNKGVHVAKAGEFGLMAVLMLHSHIPSVVFNQRNAVYDSLYSSPIAGKTLVVLGTGSLGGSTARKVRQLNVQVIGVNRSGSRVEGCDRVVTTAQLDDVLPDADYLLIATPDTPLTRGLMSRARLDLMKTTAGIVNIGRESVMDYDALCDKLDEGTLGGAILDVFDPEPIAADSRLWTTRNLIVTPHISADDGNSYVPMTLSLFFRNLRLFLSGKSLQNPVNPELGY
ncbi:MAG: D-2-hydroxyacid dehydrogenase [Acidiferrobacterales bacterium]|nr:D-2-hydroxyacid dehydrogenase [Acidiferrobacterales bacterium]